VFFAKSAPYTLSGMCTTMKKRFEIKGHVFHELCKPTTENANGLVIRQGHFFICADLIVTIE
ncbi:hypothetical protein, partial [Aquitalea sp. LB_tupeE]|uniref:hypothetical protein n=1 Tax=Aquitalea sp. LB_tupeE TaxID=2748078 RepID=UPI001C4D4E9D